MDNSHISIDNLHTISLLTSEAPLQKLQNNEEVLYDIGISLSVS